MLEGEVLRPDLQTEEHPRGFGFRVKNHSKNLFESAESFADGMERRLQDYGSLSFEIGLEVLRELMKNSSSMWRVLGPLSDDHARELIKIPHLDEGEESTILACTRKGAEARSTRMTPARIGLGILNEAFKDAPEEGICETTLKEIREGLSRCLSEMNWNSTRFFMETVFNRRLLTEENVSTRWLTGLSQDIQIHRAKQCLTHLHAPGQMLVISSRVFHEQGDYSSWQNEIIFRTRLREKRTMVGRR